MSMQTAKRARLPPYELRNPGHVLTAMASKSKYDTTREPMFQLENSYFDITSRSRIFCRMWCLDYHGFEAIIQLSSGRNGTRTSNMVRVHTGCLLTNQDIPSSCSFKPLRSWTFLRYFHPVPRKRVWLEILPHMPRNAPTYTRPHTSRTVLTCTMSPKRKMVSRMRTAAIWRLSTFRCRNCKERSVELISWGIKCFCAVCLDPQCRSIKCIRCKQAMTMTGLTPFDANCLFEYTSGRTSTTGRKTEYGDLPPHGPGRDHRIRLNSEDNPPWVHPYKMDRSQLDEL